MDLFSLSITNSNMGQYFVTRPDPRLKILGESIHDLSLLKVTKSLFHVEVLFTLGEVYCDPTRSKSK
jgi:hypothetical protein